MDSKLNQRLDAEQARTDFMFNTIDFDSQISELKSYLDLINKSISETEFDLKRYEARGLSEEGRKNLNLHFQYVHGEILRRTIFISTIMLLEASVDIYCRVFQKHKKLELSYRDFKGSFLDKFKLYYKNLLESSFDFSSLLWKDIKAMYEIRNCLIHERGLIADNKRQLIEEFVRRNSTFDIGGDNSILITHAGCVFGLETVENFYDGLFRYALDYFQLKD